MTEIDKCSNTTCTAWKPQRSDVFRASPESSKLRIVFHYFTVSDNNGQTGPYSAVIHIVRVLSREKNIICTTLFTWHVIYSASLTLWKGVSIHIMLMVVTTLVVTVTQGQTDRSAAYILFASGPPDHLPLTQTLVDLSCPSTQQQSVLAGAEIRTTDCYDHETIHSTIWATIATNRTLCQSHP